ncbi:MAG: glycosyltransferase family 2 protein [Candidatus Dormibacteraeota bacterium]|nr:glycosyltransferase family 2 protein [Candidatus Dormibacteraeota bacterium]
MQRAPEATIIIATRNRAALLRDALASIRADQSSVPREVIVVDNGSTDATPAVLAEASRVQARMPLRCLTERRPGKAQALNAAVLASRGDCLLFTDDDVLVGNGWADGLCGALSAGTVGAAGGRVQPIWSTPPPSWLTADLAASLGIRDLGDDRRAVGPLDIIGANMGLRRAALQELGEPFSSSLGPRGRVKTDFEEAHLLQLVSARWQLVYEPTARVKHRIQPERLSPKWIRRMFYQRGFGRSLHDQMMGIHEPQRPDLSDRARALLFLRRAWGYRRRHARTGGWDAARAALEVDAFFWAGYHLDMALQAFPLPWRRGLARLV